MAMKRSDYMRFRRTGGSLTSQSSYAATIARKQQAAEDDYYDNAYKTGLLSASDYLNNLRQRSIRTYLTPLQKQNLTQKIDETTRDYEDSQIETAYKTGATYNGQPVDTKFMLDRAKTKLDSMVPGSETYNKQQATVASLEDKVSTENRRTFRTDELQKLSTMRETTSDEMQAKASLYEKLEAMARNDGETYEAQQYEIQKNNYSQSADKARVNERIQDVVVKNSTPYDPMSKTSTAGGAQVGGAAPAGGLRSQQIAGDQGTEIQGASNEPAAPSEIPDGAPEMVQAYGITMDKDVYDALARDPSISRYMGKINNYVKAIQGDGGRNGLNQQIADQYDLVQVYKDELANAKADNRDWLTKSYNDAVEKYNTMTTKRDDYLANIDEEQGGFQEFIQKKVVSIMKDKDTDFERQLDKTTRDIETKFAKGEIGADQYVKDTYNVMKQAATVYSMRQQQYTELNDAVGLSQSEKRLATYGERAEIIATQIDPKLKNGSLRMVQSDKDNPETLNLATMSTGVKKGDFTLVDPTAGAEDPEAAVKEWDNSHAQLGGKWYPVQADLSKAPENFQDPEAKAEYAKSKNEFVISQIKDGKEVLVPIKAVKYDNGTVKYVPQQDIQKYLDNGYFKQKGDEIVRSYQEVNVPWEATKNIAKALPGGFIKAATDILQGKPVEKFANWIGDKLPGTYNQDTGSWRPFDKDPNQQGFLQKAKDLIVPQAHATDTWNYEKKKPSEELKESGFLSPVPDYVLDGESNPNAPTPTPSATWIDAMTQQAIGSLPVGMQASAKQNIPYIIEALKKQNILNPNNLAYALATINHETGGTFRPIEEYGGRNQAKKLGYSGGENYYGRGYIQLTHDYNYKDIGKKIGLGDKLYTNPELALRPDIAADILATFMKDRGVTQYTEKGDFVGARKPINGIDRAGQIANVAQSYMKGISQAPANQTITPVTSSMQTQKSTPAVQYQPKPESFIDKVINFFKPAQAKAAEQNYSSQPQKNYSSQPASQPQPSYPIASMQGGGTKYSDGSVKYPMSTPKPAPAPAPKPQNYSSQPKQPNFLDQAKKAVSNVTNTVSSWFKKWF